LELLDGDGKPLRMERRLLRKFARDASLRVSPHRINAAPGQRFTVEVSAEGASWMGRVTVAAYSEARYAEQHARVRLNASGRARVAFSAPADETLLTVVAFEDDPELPPLERAADWAAVEVRRPR
jgi:hypothetical protein